MIELKMATPDDWKIVQAIAHKTWPHTFGSVMPKAQIEYMLSLTYNEQSLKVQMIDKQHQFLLALRNNKAVGFCSYELNYWDELQLMIHKLYILPEAQGLGIGTKLFNHLIHVAGENGQKRLRLKVFHKNERAADFYFKQGFTNAGTESTDIGNGYIILDNVLIKEL